MLDIIRYTLARSAKKRPSGKLYALFTALALGLLGGVWPKHSLTLLLLMVGES